MTVCPAKTQISLGISPVWSKSSPCMQWVAKDPSFLHADSEDSVQTGRMPRLIWVFAGHAATLLVLSCHGSILFSELTVIFLAWATFFSRSYDSNTISVPWPPYLPLKKPGLIGTLAEAGKTWRWSCSSFNNGLSDYTNHDTAKLLIFSGN